MRRHTVEAMDSGVGLFLAGDVMTGRGVDQILAHPGATELREAYVTEARTYVELAEQANGPIPMPVADTWPWGQVLPLVEAHGEAFRVMNLETSVTRSDDWLPGKAVHYRMTPENIDCLSAVGADVWTLANNHVLDFGVRGLEETLDVLADAGLRTVGAGRNVVEAWRPAVVAPDGRRLLVWSVAHQSSGVPLGWAATETEPGVALLPDLSDDTAATLAARVRQHRRPGDLVVVSVHWGANWGYSVSPAQRQFAHRLVDAGVNVVHGHSSHHPRPVEVYRGGLVLYGCGDLVNDYEGIRGYDRYRGDLRLLYLATLDPDTGRLLELRMFPLQVRRMRLEEATPSDARWLADTLDREGRALGTGVALADDGSLRLMTL